MKYAAPHGAVGKSATLGVGPVATLSRPSRLRTLATVSPIALLLGLTGLTLPAAAAPCTPDTTGCNAAGGQLPRAGSGNGGEGNGGGGNGLISDSGTPVATPGGTGASGAGGSGGAGENGTAAGGAVGYIVNGLVGFGSSITGGHGDPGTDGPSFAGGGGGGGAGVYMLSGDAYIGLSTVLIKGGDGGKGGDVTAGVTLGGGGGGGGGAGLIGAGPGTVENYGSIVGGNGGVGGQSVFSFSGAGGGGGDGILVQSSAVYITNLGSITGGKGGAASTTALGSSPAGDSGSGVNFANSFGVLTNAGTVAGGDANGGAAGVGVMTNGYTTITNAGVISGGLNNDGVTRAAAIRFGGIGNQLNLLTGSTIVGDIQLIASARAAIAAQNAGLALNNAIALGTNSTVTFDTSTTGLTVSGVISGTGKVLTTGAGSVVLSGANTYTGGTQISGGTTSVSSDANLGDAAGALIFDGGILQITGTSFTGTSRTIQWGGGGFDIVDANNSFTLNQAITGINALDKLGAGTLILNGNNGYIGATTVDAGKLVVNGSIALSSLLSVNSGAIIGGNGVLPTTEIASGGILAPGNSIGTLTVSGDLTLHSGSAYNVEVSPTAADRTNVTGIANLAGDVNASYAMGSYTSKRYTILNAAGGINGKFGTLNNTNLPGNVTAALNYDLNDVYLDLTLIYQDANQRLGGLNANQRGVSTALTNYFNATGGIPTAFVTLSANGLSQASGEAGSSIVVPMANDATLFTNAVFDGAFGALNEGREGPRADAAGGPGSALGFAPAERVSKKASEAFASLPLKAQPSDAFASRWGVWASGYGAASRVSGDAAVGSSTTNSRIYGAVAGASYRLLPNTVVGFALGGAGTDFSLDGGFGSGKADIFHAAVYGLHNIGRAYVAGLVGYGWQEASTDRTMTAAGMDVLHASFRPQTVSGRLEAGYRLATPLANVTPYGALQMASFFIPSYSESAISGSNQFALAYDARTASAVRTELGVRLAKAYALSTGMLTLKGRAAWAYDSYNGRGATATFQTLPGATFAVNGARPEANVALLSAGADYGLGNGWSLAASFDGEFSGNSTVYGGKGAIRRVW
ncbi:autotransporter outer membrane beta-barrel domain-containing protein [Pseudolabrys taiwanensis]|uniref:autotransporter outer membrane beta-barrel domain-containing protein n=1 Tax=Pseudolabrys taiwanensis TaxID=331696 RepID=UPI001FE1BE02|nr:autotransporter outer membrane beta-barrel domain-containing protein [Pseudolabrys taiwanensis]